MDLQTIAARTGLPLRKLRYVFDHRLLPGLRVKHATEMTGHPRYLTSLEALGVACAAALVEGGMRREAVVDVLTGLTILRWSSNGPKQSLTLLEKAGQTGVSPALASLADGAYLRFQIGKRDTSWLNRTSFAVEADFRPRVIVQVDVAALRDAIGI
ncbi:MAG: hypothetical protein WD894_14860 [Pirellulales bacterium]